MKMNKKLKANKFIAVLVAAAATAAFFTGCDKNESDEVEYIDNPAITFEQIELDVFTSELDISDNYRIRYTNNSDYPIIGLEMYYVTKQDITDKEKESLKASLQNNHSVAAERLESNIVFKAGNGELISPGETSSYSKIFYNGGTGDVDAADFELTEAGMYIIEYIDGNEIITLVCGGYDKKYYIDETAPKYNWGKDELTKTLPKPDAEIITADTLFDGEIVEYIVYDVTEEQFSAYVETCEENGYTGELNGYEYSAENADGYKLSVSYENNMMHIWLDNFFNHE